MRKTGKARQRHRNFVERLEQFDKTTRLGSPLNPTRRQDSKRKDSVMDLDNDNDATPQRQEPTRRAYHPNEAKGPNRPCEKPLVFRIGPDWCKVILWGEEFHGIDAEKPGQKLRRERERVKAAGLMGNQKKSLPEG
jgi:hypothetical protein